MGLVLQVLEKTTNRMQFLLLGRNATARVKECAGAVPLRTRTKTRTEKT